MGEDARAPSARSPDAADAEVFAAVITPHRSLGSRGAAILIGGFAILSAIVSVPFFLVGAWPVVGFFGLDALLLWLALRASFAQARACERVVLTYVELVVRRISPRGVESVWRFNPLWVRLETETDEDFGMTRVAIWERQASLDVARALSPGERAEFADAFGAALAKARRGALSPAER
ncbi:DUF2244 domain-containing protein [Methylopila turkensis]|uniref:Membrane protein n=1 Tax=Methylopila turkensis TaxID=1437816 RepID=A0A9W6JKT9_9HYPH|nr:DUF2244 domain-containing protein [Methylopila turkensis]GLK78922.1 membrane protein [Methylopila turkensis]